MAPLSNIKGLLAGRSWAFWERKEALLRGLPASGPRQLHGTSTAGLTYTLRASTNLLDWVEHTNVVAHPTGLIECLEDMDPDAPACFYRVSGP